MINPYFNFTTSFNEQNLVENMIIESIQMYGMDIIFAPKTTVDYDALLGEDPQKAFNSNFVIESYMENIEGFMGDKNFLNKMGLNIDKQATFVIAKRRFDEVVLGLNWRDDWDTLMTYNIKDAIHYNGKIYVSAIDANIGITPNTDMSWTIMSQVRPLEGDLIFLPITHDIFEILFADHEEVFYQLGKIYVWKITCEKYRISHEEFTTGNTEIDKIAADLQSDGTIDRDPLADNDHIEDKMDDFLNLDPKNPFGA